MAKVLLKEINSGSWQRKSEGSRPELGVMRPAPEDHNRLKPPSCNCKVAGIIVFFLAKNSRAEGQRLGGKTYERTSTS